MFNPDDYDDFFITSDTWFGRGQILEISPHRIKFNNIDEMNQQIIDNWNSVVKPDDLVIHLGNFAWDPLSAVSVAKKLNGKIAILNNNQNMIKLELEFKINERKLKNIRLYEEQILKSKNHDVILSCYPLTQWPGQHHDTLQVHGHSILDNETTKTQKNKFNATVDCCNMLPIKLSTIKELLTL